MEVHKVLDLPRKLELELLKLELELLKLELYPELELLKLELPGARALS